MPFEAQKIQVSEGKKMPLIVTNCLSTAAIGISISIKGYKCVEFPKYIACNN